MHFFEESGVTFGYNKDREINYFGLFYDTYKLRLTKLLIEKGYRY